MENKFRLKYLKKWKKDDLLITMGAGNVYLIGESMLNKTKKESNKEAVWR